jgi:5-methylcytosine-specific restriction endonuclease McrA
MPPRYASPKWNNPTQRCDKCGQEKPTPDFVVKRRQSDMLTDTCSACRVPRSFRQKASSQVSQAKVRARAAGVKNTLTTGEWLAALEASEGVCHYCGVYYGVENLTIEHVVSISHGGAHAIENVVPACWTCNRKKGYGC